MGVFDNITLYTINHKSAPYEVIGSLANVKDEVYKALEALVDEVVVLYTCNRFEVYINSRNNNIVEETLRNVLGDRFSYARILRGVEAVRHLLRVAAGLESAILGENEILGQVKRAWLEALENGHIRGNGPLHQIFHRAVLAGKRVRSETGISRGVIGYPQGAVVLASRVLGPLDGRSVLVIGAGEAGEIIVDSICKKYKPARLIVASRTPSRAAELAESCEAAGSKAGIHVGDLKRYLDGVDIIFVATDSPEVVDTKSLMESRAVIVDISTPPIVKRVEGKSYVIDDVEEIAREGLEARKREVPKVEAILEEELRIMEREVAMLSADELIKLLMSYAEEVSKHEIGVTINSLRKRSPEEALEIAFRSYARKLYRPIILALRDAALGADVIEALRHRVMREYSKRASGPQGDSGG